jgi:hypothetical protein
VFYIVECESRKAFACLRRFLSQAFTCLLSTSCQAGGSHRATFAPYLPTLHEIKPGANDGGETHTKPRPLLLPSAPSARKEISSPTALCSVLGGNALYTATLTGTLRCDDCYHHPNRQCPVEVVPWFLQSSAGSHRKNVLGLLAVS